MSVIITGINKKTPASKDRLIFVGDTLVSINDNVINDILDYDFYNKESVLKLQVKTAGNLKKTVFIEKDEDEDLGLTFDTYLIDSQKCCKNKCVFCFIDQLPSGMRESLYFKDDDSRLSFLFGNYITLTNLTQHDIDRIIKMRISPINISVHTTNPKLRVFMMKNKDAGNVLNYLEQLANADIKINTQLVICPDINDGDELLRSLTDLSAFYPAIQSIAVVPVGLTKFRDNLEKINPFNEQTARNTIALVENFGKKFNVANETKLVFLADEFYIKANLPQPDFDYYEDFPQLENGVGMLANFKNQFLTALESIPIKDKKRKISIATGVDNAPFIRFLVDELRKKWHNLECTVYPIKNKFFGETITVSGLITGSDLISGLEGKNLGKELLIPSNMLKYDCERFLDDVTLKELIKKLSIKIKVVPQDGEAFLKALIK